MVSLSNHQRQVLEILLLTFPGSEYVTVPSFLTRLTPSFMQNRVIVSLYAGLTKSLVFRSNADIMMILFSISMSNSYIKKYYLPH
jgi:uncharacterized protein YqhQ